MNNFVYECKTKIIFGKDTERETGELVKKYGNKIMICCGQGSVKRSGLFDRVVKSLTEAGVSFVEFGGAQPNPRLSLVQEGIQLCREENIQFILAIGGGSTIDTAKAIALGAPYEGSVWDFYAGKAEPKDALPLGVVLTIPAAGSESSIFSVITNEDECKKIGYGSELMRPRFAVMNPELTYSLPPYQTACGCVDIMMHTLERYFTNTEDVEFIDRMCEALLKTMTARSVQVIAEPDNYNARADVMWAGSISHNGLLETGRIGDWASHDMEHEMGAIYDIAHGAGLAVVFPAWCKYVYKKNLKRFVQFAVRVMGVEEDFENPEKTALAGIAKVEKLFKKIGMPVRMHELGIDETRFCEMADKCTREDTVKTGNLYPLGREDIVKIFRMSL